MNLALICRAHERHGHDSPLPETMTELMELLVQDVVAENRERNPDEPEFDDERCIFSGRRVIFVFL